MSHLQKCVEIDQENKIFIGDQTKHSCGKRDFESGIIYVAENRTILEKKIKSFSAKRIILVAGLRYSSASGIITGVSVITKRLKLHVTAVVSTPFEAEGQNAIVNSSKAINALNQNVDKLIDFSCEDLMQENGGKLLIKDIDGKFEEEIFEALQLPRESKVHTQIIRKSYGK
jgi:cell division GTPase FtsZ